MKSKKSCTGEAVIQRDTQKKGETRGRSVARDFAKQAKEACTGMQFLQVATFFLSAVCLSDSALAGEQVFGHFVEMPPVRFACLGVLLQLLLDFFGVFRSLFPL